MSVDPSTSWGLSRSFVQGTFLFTRVSVGISGVPQTIVVLKNSESLLEEGEDFSVFLVSDSHCPDLTSE